MNFPRPKDLKKGMAAKEQPTASYRIVGAGDFIKAITRSLGIPACAKCDGRADALNRRLSIHLR